jgi:hypothetical protein
MQSRGPDIAEALFNYLFATPSSAGPFTAKSALAFATVLGDMLLQARDGHRHPHCELPLFGRRKVSEPYQPPHPTARLDKLAFEPSMFRTTYRQRRSRIHHAPVENREWQISIAAKKKQTLFSPYIRPRGARRTWLMIRALQEGRKRHPMHSSDRQDDGDESMNIYRYG